MTWELEWKQNQFLILKWATLATNLVSSPLLFTLTCSYDQIILFKKKKVYDQITWRIEKVIYMHENFLHKDPEIKINIHKQSHFKSHSKRRNAPPKIASPFIYAIFPLTVDAWMMFLRTKKNYLFPCSASKLKQSGNKKHSKQLKTSICILIMHKITELIPVYHAQHNVHLSEVSLPLS